MSAFMFPSFFFNFRACNLFVCVVRTGEGGCRWEEDGGRINRREKHFFFFFLCFFWLLLLLMLLLLLLLLLGVFLNCFIDWVGFDVSFVALELRRTFQMEMVGEGEKNPGKNPEKNPEKNPRISCKISNKS